MRGRISRSLCADLCLQALNRLVGMSKRKDGLPV